MGCLDGEIWWAHFSSSEMLGEDLHVSTHLCPQSALGGEFKARPHRQLLMEVGEMCGPGLVRSVCAVCRMC